jgi:hypothetical protein
MITGALDRSMTIDNRLFTEAGRESIGEDFENFGGNTLLTVDGGGGGGQHKRLELLKI